MSLFQTVVFQRPERRWESVRSFSVRSFDLLFRSVPEESAFGEDGGRGKEALWARAKAAFLKNVMITLGDKT
nr:MAG TPA: hypothetical protein [Caudoviricetes sp.]